MLLEAMATKGRMGEWLDAHPRTALAVLVALMLLASVRW